MKISTKTAASKPPTKEQNPLAVREYEIAGVKYIVTAAVRDGVTEDAAAKVRRLIRNELAGNTGA
jgi:uncharacterized protein YajQ (UPF0234 family)